MIIRNFNQSLIKYLSLLLPENFLEQESGVFNLDSESPA
jgi:hypothetical protein